MAPGPGLSFIIVMRNMKQTKAKQDPRLKNLNRQTMNEVDGLMDPNPD